MVDPRPMDRGKLPIVDVAQIHAPHLRAKGGAGRNDFDPAADRRGRNGRRLDGRSRIGRWHWRSS
jgi:hypothetical protein